MAPVIPCPVLVGRAKELEVLLGALDAACAGRGAVAFLTGEAGIGKTRLAQEVAASATARGAVVLRGRAVPGSGAAAYRPLTEALAPVTVEADDPELAPWLPALAGMVPAVGATAGADESPAVRGEAVLRLLRAACGARGGVLVLEDLHWADPETVAVVEHLADNLERAPVLAVVTVRTGEGSAAAGLVRRVADRRAAPVLALDRLNAAQVAAMVHSCGGGEDGGLDRLAGLAEGVPFLVEELLVSPGLPASFAEGVAARLSALGDDDRKVLVTAAAFGHHFDWRLLAGAAGVEEAAVVGALERGTGAQLLDVDDDGFRFRHALTAEAVFQSVIPPRREACARAALAALDAAHPTLPGAMRDTAARLAERAGDAARAGALLLAAGEEALDCGALGTATGALERAVALAPEGDLGDTAGERLVQALALVGRLDDALAAARPLARRLPSDRVAAVRLRLAGAAITAARWDLAAEQLGLAAPLVAAAGSVALDAELALRQAELAIDTADPAHAAARAAAALEQATVAGAAAVECAALALLGRCARRESLESAETWFRQALAAAEAHGLALWRLRALHELGTIALLDRSAVDELLAARELAVSLGALATVAVLDIEIAAGYAGLDEPDAQAWHGLEAARRGTELGLPLVAAYGWHHKASAAAVRGDHAAVDEAAALARAAAPPGNRDIDAMLIGAEVLMALRADDLHRALALSERYTDLLRGSVTAPPAHFRAALPLLRAVLGVPGAAELVEELESTLATSRGARGCLTMARAVLAGAIDPDRAAELARRADGDLVYMASWQCFVRRLAAQAAMRDGWPVADEWMVESESRLRRLGMDAAADACRALQRSADGMPAPWRAFGISRREADVLWLVMEGLANREIAERLHLSVRTVEKHVEALLRKTASRTRTQLARVAATT